MPLSQSSLAIVSEPSPPIEMSASIPRLRAFSISSSERSSSTVVPSGKLARIAERVAAVGRAQNRAAQVGDAADGLARERDDFVFAHQPGESALDPEHVPAAVDRGEHGGADDGIESGRVAAARGDRDSHAARSVVANAGTNAARTPARWRRSTARAPGVEQSDDLARPRMPAEFRFLEYRFAVGYDLEASAARRDQLDRGIGPAVSNLGRQTDGPRFVVSHRTVFDRDGHLDAVREALVGAVHRSKASENGTRRDDSAAGQRGMLFSAARRLITVS